ncbi:hypothetical protein [Streptomyces decoyicus]|uniref:hypothetical protein n=1 Tax=Streptomyces decoyicus TaxID=249567 RepID=UPI002E16B5F0|nr:hypothetical protein OG532_38720 [Streptomyces decoyicus]
MNGGGRFYRWHPLAEARRHFALVLLGRPGEPAWASRSWTPLSPRTAWTSAN